MNTEIFSPKSEDTVRLGKRLSRFFCAGDIVCLFGDLGSGKTTFTKGIAKGLGINEKEVNSPTFVLMNEYDGRLPLYHFDLYRIKEAGDILGLGYEEFLYGEGVSVIEWADKLGVLFPKECLEVHIQPAGETGRTVQFVAKGKRAERLIGQLGL